VGLEDRDWYREESSPIYRRELARSTGGTPRSTATATIGGGAAAAALISLAIWMFSSQAGVTPRLILHRSSPRVPHTIDLGNRPDLVAVGPAGRRWCVDVPGRRVCAVTGSSESGRDALTRALRAQGYAVRAAP
jgi:hypothetical protein